MLGHLEHLCHRYGTSRFLNGEALEDRMVNSAGFRRRDGHDRMNDLLNTEGWKHSPLFPAWTV